MPAKMMKEGNGFTVSTPNAIHGRHMNEENAKSQMRLLNALEYGWKPTGKKKKSKNVLKDMMG